MRYSLKVVVGTIVAFQLTVIPVAGQQSAPPPPPSQNQPTLVTTREAVAPVANPAPAAASRIVIRVTPSFPPTAIRYIGQIGNTSEAQVNTGDDARALLVDKCGDAPTQLATLVEEIIQFNPRLVSSDMKASASGALRLPACPRVEQNVKVTVERDTLTKVFLRGATGFEADSTTNAFLAVNPELRVSPDPNAIKAGTEVHLPYRSEWTVIELKPGAGVTARQALDRLQALIRQSRSQKKADSIKTGVSSQGSIIASVPVGSLTSGGSGCFAPTMDWPFKAQELVSALSRNNQLAIAANLYKPDIGIAVLDGGFVEPPRSPFDEARIKSRGLPWQPKYYGVDGATKSGAPLSLTNIDDANHGTMVAALALGGPAFMAVDTAKLSTLRVRMSSVIEPLPPRNDGTRPGQVLEQFVAYALQDAIDTDVTIINMSFEFPSETSVLKQYLRANPRLLLVVAAGNEPQNLGNYPTWPAAFGGVEGETADRVITVGASSVKLSGGGVPAASRNVLADFSSFGMNDVDILAPGCQVPTLGLDLKNQPGTGTSFSSPLVAFTAGLLRQLDSNLTPEDIKRRILVSTDVDPALLYSVRSSGVLNPAKAVEIFADRLELDGESAPLLGRADLSDAGEWSCKDGSETVAAPSIVKIARLGPTGTKDWLVFWKSLKGLRRCIIDLSGQSFEFQTSKSSPRQTILPADLIDFIARSE